MNYILQNNRKWGTVSGAEAAVAKMTPRRIPLASFFPALGSKHGVIFLGFVKHCPGSEEIVSIDECFLRIHQFRPFRVTGEMCGQELLRLPLLGPPSYSDGNLLISNVTCLITRGVIVSIVVNNGSDKTTIKVFRYSRLVYTKEYTSATSDHCLYRGDYLSQDSPFALIYRSSSHNIVVVSLVDIDNNGGLEDDTIYAGDIWRSGGAAWHKRTITSAGLRISEFDARSFATDYINKIFRLYYVDGAVTAVLVSSNPSLELLSVVIHVPLDKKAERKSSLHLIMFVSFAVCTGNIMVRRTLDAADIYSGPQKIEFSGYCTARGFKKAYPCVPHFCRDTIKEDDDMFIAKERFCTTLSNFSVSSRHKSSPSESWLLEIEHPSLPLVVYNDEVVSAMRNI